MADEGKTIAIYARVSTQTQDTGSQLADLDRWLKAQPDPHLGKRFLDKCTGKSVDRPG